MGDKTYSPRELKTNLKITLRYLQLMRKKKNKPASLIVTSELLLSDQIILGFGNHICRMRLSILL